MHSGKFLFMGISYLDKFPFTIYANLESLIVPDKFCSSGKHLSIADSSSTQLHQFTATRARTHGYTYNFVV